MTFWKFILLTGALTGVYYAATAENNPLANLPTVRSNSPIEVSQSVRYNGVTFNGFARSDTLQITILSKVDSIKIEAITLNRGNCMVPNWDIYGNQYYTHLKYGQKISFDTNCSTILSADIKTSLGQWSYTFDTR